MYTIIAAKGIKNVSQARWADVDVSADTVATLFRDYRVIYLTLTAGFLPDPIFVNLEVFKTSYNTFEGTVDEMLTDNGATTFETVAALPVIETNFIEYSDMFRAGYSMEVTGRNQHPSSVMPPADKVDICIQRNNPQTDMVDVFNHCLITVNGFYHMTDTDGEYLYVYDGGKSNYRSRRNTIGMVSFKNIGGIKQVPITEDMIYRQTTGQSRFYDKTYIKLNEDVSNKTVLLVLGGYLVLPTPGVFYQNSPNNFGLSLGRLPLIERYYESKDCIDYDSLGIDSSNKNPSMINVAQFYSDECISKYLTHSQTFFVIVDTPHFFTNKYYVESSPIPGTYVCGFEPKYPMVLGRGKMPEYWSRFEIDRYALDIVDGNLHRRVFTELDDDTKNNVSDSDQPVPNTYNSQAYLLEIGSDIHL